MALLLENDPRARGLNPDGDPVLPGAVPAQAEGASVSEAIRSPQFMALYAACLICSFGLFVPFVHLVPYAGDHGVAASSAVLLLGVIGIGSTAGRFFLGGLADRIGRQSALLLLFIGMALALAIWLVSTNFWQLAGFAFVYGMIYGAWVAVLPAVVMDYFGGRNVSGIIGILYTSVAFGTLIGPSTAGFAFDLTGDYTLPITGRRRRQHHRRRHRRRHVARGPRNGAELGPAEVVIGATRYLANVSLTRLANVNSISAR